MAQLRDRARRQNDIQDCRIPPRRRRRTYRSDLPPCRTPERQAAEEPVLSALVHPAERTSRIRAESAPERNPELPCWARPLGVVSRLGTVSSPHRGPLRDGLVRTTEWPLQLAPAPPVVYSPRAARALSSDG